MWDEIFQCSISHQWLSRNTEWRIPNIWYHLLRKTQAEIQNLVSTLISEQEGPVCSRAKATLLLNIRHRKALISLVEAKGKLEAIWIPLLKMWIRNGRRIRVESQRSLIIWLSQAVQSRLSELLRWSETEFQELRVRRTNSEKCSLKKAVIETCIAHWAKSLNGWCSKRIRQRR